MSYLNREQDDRSLFDALGLKPREVTAEKLTGITPEMMACGTIGESASGLEERGTEGGVGGGVGGEEFNRQKGAGEVVSLYVRLAKFASDYAPPGGKPIETVPQLENNFDLADHVAPLGEALYRAVAHLLFRPTGPTVSKAGLREWADTQMQIIDASERLSAIFAGVSSDAYRYLRSGIATENRPKAEAIAALIINEALPLGRLFAAGSERYWANIEHGFEVGRFTAEDRAAVIALIAMAEVKSEMYRTAFGLPCD